MLCVLFFFLKYCKGKIKKWKDYEDKEALDKLILSNIKAVLKEAYRTKKSNPNISHEDLIQEGLAGLLRAVEKFDAKQNVTFLTYKND